MNTSEIAAAIERIVADVAVQIKDDVVIAPFNKLHDDLGMDGLDLLEIEHALNARFGIILDEDIDLRFSVADLINLVNRPAARESRTRSARGRDQSSMGRREVVMPIGLTPLQKQTLDFLKSYQPNTRECSRRSPR